jgi:hypothetical protein
MKENFCWWCKAPIDEQPIDDTCQEQPHWEAYSNKLKMERNEAILKLREYDENHKQLLKEIKDLFHEEISRFLKECSNE